MKKNDILFLDQYFYPEYVSTATLPTELAEDLVKAGYTVDVLCGYPKEYFNGNKVLKKESYREINIRRVKYLQFNRKTKIGRLINFLSFLTSVTFKWFWIAKHRCIIVYSNPPLLPIYSALAKVVFGTKFVFVAYDIYPDLALLFNKIKKDGLIDKLMNMTNKLVYDNASKIVALSNEMKDYMIESGLVKNNENIEVIPNWYDTNNVIKTINLLNQKIKALKTKNKFIVLYSGNMGTLQDMDTIIQCIYLLKDDLDILFVLSGHGNKMDDLKRFAYERNLRNVIFYGFLLGSDYTDILTIADCCIVSLSKGVEGLSVPSKTYGYFCAGKPIIAIMSSNTDISITLEQYKAGFTISQGETESLAKVIKKMSKDSNACKNMGINARKAFVENYERTICTNKYLYMLKTVLEGCG